MLATKLSVRTLISVVWEAASSSLRINDIPLGARILAIVGYFDTMVSARSPQKRSAMNIVS